MNDLNVGAIVSAVQKNCHISDAHPILVSSSVYRIIEKERIFLLPYLVTSLPEKGIINNCPTGKQSKTVPS